MSNIHKGYSRLSLSIPDSDIEVIAYFTTLDSFISCLDIDYLGSLSNFYNFRNLNVDSAIVAYLYEQEGVATLEDQFAPAKTCQLICSSKEDNFSSIFVILPNSNPYIHPSRPSNYILLNFKLDLLLSTLDCYTSHIENIKNSNFIIQKKYSELILALSAKSNETSQNSCKVIKLEETNSLLLGELSLNKQKILKLHQKFENLTTEESKCGVHLRCVLCENNLKSIVYLPCGHVLVCEECLVQNLKTEANAVLERRRKCLYCQTCKEKVRETKSLSLN